MESLVGNDDRYTLSAGPIKDYLRANQKVFND
jgi:hypothetical protein